MTDALNITNNENNLNKKIPIINIKNVYKDFGNIRALEDINLTVNAGEVVGLVGDNGAGKSTLLKVITGYLRPSLGSIIFNGQETIFKSPMEARQLGIETVYQDLAIVEELSLWRNFFLGKELTKGFGIFKHLDIDKMKVICIERLKDIGLTRIRNADEVAFNLSGGERQSLAITRAVFFETKLLLLDEPTAALSIKETKRVFDSIVSAKKAGLGVIYIDHNLQHVHPIADKIIILEHGRIIKEARQEDISLSELSIILSKK